MVPLLPFWQFIKGLLRETSQKLRYGFGSISLSLEVGVSSLAASVSCVKIVVIACILSKVSNVTSTRCTQMLLSGRLLSLSACLQ